MEVIDFKPINNYENKCGEIFLTINGEILLLCTLCDCKYKSFEAYTGHLVAEHYHIDTLDEYSLATKIVEEHEAKYESCIQKDLELESDPSQIITVGSTLKENELSMVDIKQESTEGKESESVHLQNCESLHGESRKNNREDRLNLEEEIRKPTSKLKKETTSESNEDRRFKCTVCDFCCTDQSNLKGHMRRHSNEKPHQCNECQKEFYTRTELKSHYRRHTGERPFLCTVCGLTFFTAGILSSHMKRHNNLRDKECSFCKKRFFDKGSLESHIRIHTGIRPFKCKLCDSRFKTRNALVGHIKMHENKREHQCEFCPARFNQKFNLNAHKKSKHLLAENAPTKNSQNFFSSEDGGDF